MIRRDELKFFSSMQVALMLAFVATLLVGCAGTTRMYEGGPKAPNEVSIISTDVRVRALEVDGRRVTGSSYEVLPGEHSVNVKITFLGDEVSSGLTGLRRTCTADAKFIADGGQEYRVMRVSKKGKQSGGGGAFGYTHEWGVYLQNMTSGETIEDAMSQMNCAN